MECEAKFSERDSESIDWIEQVLPDLAPRLLGRSLLDEQFAQLPIAQFRLVKALPLDDLGETMGRLSEKLRIKGSALTQAADRAIRQGLVERVSDPEDRRVVRLRLTSQGRKWTQERQARRRARLEIIWRGIDAVERVAFVDAVQALERLGRRADALVSIMQHDNLSDDEVTPT